MTEAKYHVGQLVAVCNSDLSVVLPQTAVARRKHVVNSGLRNPVTGVLKVVTGWLYEVVDRPDYWFQEKWLRPIDKDEYTDSDLSTQPQDKETSSQ